MCYRVGTCGQPLVCSVMNFQVTSNASSFLINFSKRTAPWSFFFVFRNDSLTKESTASRF